MRRPTPRRRAPLRAIRTAAAVLAAAALAAGQFTAASDASAETLTAARTYYVDCSAKAGGDATLTRPWHSLKQVNAHGRFTSGDRIRIRRSTTCEGQLRVAGSGTSTSPIVLGAYGPGKRPLINGNGTKSGSATVQVDNPSYWTITNLHITNTTRGQYPRTYRSGLLVLNNGHRRLAGVTVRHLWVEKVSSNPGDGAYGPRDWGGISVLTTGVPGAGFDGLTLVRNRVAHVSRQGIVVSNHGWPRSYDRTVRITDNVVRSAKGDSIMLLGARGARIDHNVSADGGKMLPCPQCSDSSPSTASAGIWPTRARNVRIDHNEVYGEHADGGDGEGFDVDRSTRGVVVEYNYAHDNEGGGILFCGSRGAVARFNIFENNAKSAIAFIGSVPAKNSKIYNNTIYASASLNANVVRTFNGLHGSRISFRNNLVYSYGAGHYIWPTKKRTTAANTLVGTHGIGRPAGVGTLWQNPGLRAPGTGGRGLASLRGYKPSTGSTTPRGVAIPASVTRDFFGKRIDPKRPPRGAAG